MEYSLHTLVEPLYEPVSRTDAKAHLRIESTVTADDTLVDALVQAAREWCENYCRRSFVKRTLELRLDSFPDEILLPRGPVIALTSVQYTDQNGVLQTVDSTIYQADLYSVPARVMPVFGGLWPIAKFGTVNSVLITYTAGYSPGSPDDEAGYQEVVPAALKAAVKLIVGHLYENREQVIVGNVQVQEVPFAVKALLAPLEIRHFCLE